uniref:Transient receptor potential cation channel subfamily A member 1 homolog n=1 Tax=Phallusia mammillata TaxID=59560 RepID=A0A6F9DWC5_9ASCI|nr:transient receptor potential cation channel subfamily A member 1 homolog [Phallusia mammillata]
MDYDDDDAASSDQSKPTHVEDVKVQVIDEKKQLLDRGMSQSTQSLINWDEEAHTSKHEKSKSEEIPLKEIQRSSPNRFDKPSHMKNVDGIGLHEIAREGDVNKMRKKIQKLNPSIVTEHINKKNDCGQTALHCAVLFDHFEMCFLLVEHGADVNICDNEGQTALHKVALCTSKFFYQAVLIIELVKYLLEKGARIDIRNIDGCTPFYCAAKCGYLETMELLLNELIYFTHAEEYKHGQDKNLSNSSIVAEQINKKDGYDGRTLLHYAVILKQKVRCALLIEHGADINICDNGGLTPLHLVVHDPLNPLKKSSDIQLMKYLLEKGAHVDIKDCFGCTPLYYATRDYSVECMKLLLKASMHFRHAGETNDNILNPSLVTELLYKYDNYGLTFLYYAAALRNIEICKLVVEKVTDINVCDVRDRNALHYLMGFSFQTSHTSIQFFDHLLEMMLNAGANINAMNNKCESPLHLACTAGHTEIVGVLLQHNADVTQHGYDRRNALEYAILKQNTLCARKIIENEDWKKALSNRSKYIYGDDGMYIDTPMRRLIRKIPKIAEQGFKKCITSDGNHSDDYEFFKVKFDYEFLDDEFSSWSRGDGSAKVYDDFGYVVKDAVPYSDDVNLLKKNHPLNIMVEEKRYNLLLHPLVVSLLDYKWRKFVRPVYIFNLSLYVMFMGFFNVYMLMMPPPYSIDSSNMTSSCVAITTEAQPKFGRCYDYNLWGIVAKYFVIVFSALNLFKELSQAYLNKISYFQSFTNLFEVSLYILAILTVYSDTNSAGPNYYGVRENWQWQIGAVSIFLSWMVLIMFIRNQPTFGIYVLMFTEVLQTFLKFFIVFVLFILGFAFSFHCLLQNHYAFREWWTAVIKTSLMMIGEFQFEDIFVAQVEAIETGADEHTITVSTVNYQAVSYILFVIFVIIMSIIIMNLLVGLAVDDIKSVQENAEIERLKMQVKLTLDVQYTLPLFIRRRVVRKCRRFFPNIHRKKSSLKQWWSAAENLNASTISGALNSEKNEHDKMEKRVKSLDKKVEFLDGKVESLNGKVESLDGKVESLDGKVECLKGDVESLKEQIVTLDNRSKSMEGVMSAIASHFNIGAGQGDDDDKM